MSRSPLFLLFIAFALCSAACALTSVAAPSTVPPTSVPVVPADTATASPSPTPLLPTATPTQPPPTLTPTQPTPTSTPTTLAATPSSPDEVYQAVAAAWRKLGQAGPFHVTKKGYTGETLFQQTDIDFVPPNYHQVLSLNGTVIGEQYLFDGTLYNKIQGVWTQQPGVGAAGNMIPVDGYAEGTSDQVPKTDGKVVGVEDIAGQPAIDYSFSVTIEMLNMNSTYTVSVDQASGQVVKQVIDTPVTKTVETITYDPSITFSLPDEAKNAKTGQ